MIAVLNDAAGNFDVAETIRELEEEMLKAANNLEFEKAALLRDQVRELKRNTASMEIGKKDTSTASNRATHYGKRTRARRERA